MDEWIIQVDAGNLRKEVVERSATVPVVLDFWAPWCEPCKELGPLLERLARAGKGRFVLAKVNVDENPELTQAFQVEGIPAVMAFSGGRLVDGFQGVLPEPEVRAFLDRLAPGGAGGEVERAREMAEGGDRDGAIQVLRGFLREHSKDGAARIALGNLLLDEGRTVEARKVCDKLGDRDREGEAGRALLKRLEYAEDAGDLEELSAAVERSPQDPGALIELGKALVAAGRQEEGLAKLLDAVELDPSFDDAAARKAMLDVFEILGPDDPLANDFRYRLSLLLFS